VDHDGHTRRSVRLRWWDPAANTYRRAALVSGHEASSLPDTLLPADAMLPYDGLKPLVFGHYWMTGSPEPLTQVMACVDYSAGRGGPLVAYRWDGEPVIDPDHFVHSS
jgi:hypothetical protein